MKKIAIVGAGGLGKDVAMMLEHINTSRIVFQLAGFYDDAYGKEQSVYGYPMLGNVNDLNNTEENLQVVVAIGDPNMKKSVIGRLTSPYISYPSLVHPSVLLPKAGFVHIGAGSLVMAGATIAVNAHIGRHVLIHNGSIVGHDSQIGNYSSLMPGVNISGEVSLGEAVYMGTGALVINRRSVAENATVGAGAVVTRNLPANCTAVGVPAQPIKFSNPGQ